MAGKKPRFYTVGHSNHSISAFIEIIQSQKLHLVVDVRKIPKSRHNPQFWGERLAASLKKHKIDYVYLPELAGRRRPKNDSVNNAWTNLSFRGYADHMQSEEFSRGLKKLIAQSKRKRLVFMCAEAVPWRCHRRLIGDALVVRGYQVVDIFSKTVTKDHTLTPFAHVGRHHKLTYPS